MDCSLKYTNKLSVIIPVYNAEKYLDDCIKSVLISSFEDFELILVDDGSSDLSGQICDKYADNDKRIKVIHKKNAGVSAARNTGVENAVASWITFVDADDLIEQTFLENLYAEVENDPNIEFVQAGCTNYRKSKVEDVLLCYEPYKGNNMEHLFPIFKGLTFSKLFRSDIIQNHNIKFDESVKSTEDLLFTLDYLSHINNYVLSPEVGYLYRRDNVQSITHGNLSVNYESLYHASKHYFDGCQSYIKAHKLPKNLICKRYKHLASMTSFAIYNLYKTNSNPTCRKNIIKRDFSKEQLKCLLYVDGKFNGFVFFILILGFYTLFDLIFSYYNRNSI